jgi:hypothetical protein
MKEEITPKQLREKRIAKNNKIRELVDKHYDMLTTIAIDFSCIDEGFRIETVAGDFTFIRNIK